MHKLFDSISLESERLKVKRLDHEDAHVLFQIYSDSNAMKYRGSNPMKNIDDAFNMISESDSASKTRLGIIKKIDNTLIGTLLIKEEHIHLSRLEIGFSFGKEHWGNGYGQETLKMVEDEARCSGNINELCAWCIKDNIASTGIFHKAGFHILQQNDYPQSDFFVREMK